MRVVTSEMMREIDRSAIEERGISGIELMHRAGEGVARLVRDILPDYRGERVLVFTGPGNNGGDGWVVARLLHGADYVVKVFSTVSPDLLKGDARTAFIEAKEAGVPFEVFFSGDFDFSGAVLIVDALLGTGAKGALKGVIAEIVGKINDSGLPVVAVDNPTGMDADTGIIECEAISAIATATFGLPKLGQFRYPGRKNVGELLVVDIGYPEDIFEKMEPDWRIESAEDFYAFLSIRPDDGHKGTFGKAAIVAGSEGMSGAAVMAAESCLRSGTGLVEVVAPKGIINTIESLFRECVTKPVQEVAKKRCLSVRALGDISRILEAADACAIGPGIGTHRETVDLIGRLLPRLKCPTVIDADGLNCLADLRRRGLEIKFGAPVIITPHPGELSRLLNISVEEIIDKRFIDMKIWLQALGADVLVLKGSPTTITAKSSPIYINRTGNNGMATGGSGDVLTGTICGFLAQGLEPIIAARLGVYIHGLAGDLAAEDIGKRGMIAGDILEYLPKAIKYLERLPLFEALNPI